MQQTLRSLRQTVYVYPATNALRFYQLYAFHKRLRVQMYFLTLSKNLHCRPPVERAPQKSRRNFFVQGSCTWKCERMQLQQQQQKCSLKSGVVSHGVFFRQWFCCFQMLFPGVFVFVNLMCCLSTGVGFRGVALMPFIPNSFGPFHTVPLLPEKKKECCLPKDWNMNEVEQRKSFRSGLWVESREIK